MAKAGAAKKDKKGAKKPPEDKKGDKKGKGGKNPFGKGGANPFGGF